VADAEIRTLGALMADATADLHLCVTLLVMDVLRGDPAEPLDEGHLAGEMMRQAIGACLVSQRGQVALLQASTSELARARALLEEARRHLREHDAEYHHVTPPELLASIDAALGPEAPRG
jgi:hypothetical protein